MTGVQTCALPISIRASRSSAAYLLQEFFRDLVALGIIVLPLGKSAEDISFRVGNNVNAHALDDDLRAESLVNFKSVPVLASPGDYLNEQIQMGDVRLNRIILELRRVVQELLVP